MFILFIYLDFSRLAFLMFLRTVSQVIYVIRFNQSEKCKSEQTYDYHYRQQHSHHEGDLHHKRKPLFEFFRKSNLVIHCIRFVLFRQNYIYLPPPTSKALPGLFAWRPTPCREWDKHRFICTVFCTIFVRGLIYSI